jgi:hypothetical protein
MFIPLTILPLLFVLCIVMLARRCARLMGLLLLVPLLALASVKLWAAGQMRPRQQQVVVQAGSGRISKSTGSQRSTQTQVEATTSPATAIDPSWIDNWPLFVEKTDWHGFRAESFVPCVSENEARQKALERATDDVYQLVATDPAVTGSYRYRSAAHPMLAQQILARLKAGDFIAAQKVRSIDKGYATLWNVYLLIDTSKPNLDSLLGDFQVSADAAFTRQVQSVASLAALAAIIVLLYGFLNAATKGYFVWRLRAAAMMILIVAVLVVVAVI